MNRGWMGWCLPVLLVACSEQQDPGPEPQSQSAASKAAVAEADYPVARLPQGVRPTRYELDFTIIPDQTHFQGKARISVELDQATDKLWLHGQDLEVARASLTPEGGDPIPATLTQVDDQGVARLDLSTAAPAGSGWIEVEYQAPFNEKLAGLYKVEEDGRAYAFSQMEAIEARRAFPSFDEPAFKTPYVLTITTRSEYQAFTNARAVSVAEHEDGLKTVTYAETPPLPTYLIAFTVGPVDVVEWQDVPPSEYRSEPLQLRGIAAHGKGEKLRYALEHTAGILTTLEEYFGTAYPYDKLDIVAAPDFRAGAMENAGLILYRESLLLLDDNAPLAQRRSYASVHAHELAHQWFGNLVTMPWWDDIWLNEAFATWMGHKAVHAWNPAYFYDRNMLDRALGAMSNDSLLSARQIREPVDHNAEIENAFDGITYSKGGGVLSMFETWLGEEVFRQGIREHMQRFAHGNATVFDFIESLARVAPDKSVDPAFRSFLFQPGVPFIKTRASCEGDRALAHLSQSRYFPWGTQEDSDRRWSVPVCMSYGVDEQVREQCVLLDGPEATVELGSALTCPDWIMPNRNGSGYYRFGLDGEAIDALAGAMDALNPREKMAFADSLEAALRNGSLSAEAFLSAIPDLVNARERAVATAPIEALEEMLAEFMDDGDRAAAQAWAREVFGARLARIDNGAAIESAMEAQLMRTALVEFLAIGAEDPGLRSELADAARSYLGYGGDGQIHPDAIEPDLLRTAMTVLGEDADPALFDHMLQHLEASGDALLRGALIAGIAHVRDGELQARALELTFSQTLRVNEIPSLIFGGLGYRNRDATWGWFQANIDRLLAHLPDRFRNLTPYIGSGFCDPNRAAELAALFEPRMAELAGAQRALNQSLESIAQCSALREKQAESARAFFHGIKPA